MRVSWPSAWSRMARWRTWSLTPPGEAKSYGETSPTLMSRCSRPDPVRHMPILGVPPDEVLDAAQKLRGRVHLVCPDVARGVSEHHRGAFDLERVVGQAICAHREYRRADPKRDGRRAEWDRRQLAEERHEVAGAGDVAVDRGQHNLLFAE